MLTELKIILGVDYRSYHRTQGIQKQYRIADLSTEFKAQQGLNSTIHRNRGAQMAVPARLLKEHHRLLPQEVCV